MQLRRWHIVALLLGAAAVLVLVWWRSPGDPRHKGKTLSEWLEQADDLSYVEEPPAEVREAKEAIREMGPRAVPALVSMVAAENSAWKGLFSDLLDRQRLIRLEFHWAGEQHEKGLSGFRILGTNGRTAIPQLSTLLVRTNVARPAALALAFIGPETMPILRSALTNQHVAVRRAAVDAIFAASSNAAPALPDLMPLLNDPDDVVASGALSIISGVAPPEQSVPILVQALQNSRLERNALAWLTILGTNAAAAEPALRKRLEGERSPVVRRMITNALDRIRGNPAAQEGSPKMGPNPRSEGRNPK